MVLTFIREEINQVIFRDISGERDDDFLLVWSYNFVLEFAEHFKQFKVKSFFGRV
jgi:hypothetical protein